MSTVGIAFLSVYATVYLNVLESIIHESAFAGIVTLLSRAVHQLLFTKRYKFPSLDCMLALQRASSTESPAAPTLSLNKYSHSWLLAYMIW